MPAQPGCVHGSLVKPPRHGGNTQRAGGQEGVQAAGDDSLQPRVGLRALPGQDQPFFCWHVPQFLQPVCQDRPGGIRRLAINRIAPLARGWPGGGQRLAHATGKNRVHPVLAGGAERRKVAATHGKPLLPYQVSNPLPVCRRQPAQAAAIQMHAHEDDAHAGRRQKVDLPPAAQRHASTLRPQSRVVARDEGVHAEPSEGRLGLGVISEIRAAKSNRDVGHSQRPRLPPKV
jgi:hypothetical protein